MILREQDSELEQKDEQLEQAAQERLLLELEVSKLRNFVSECTQTTETLATELRGHVLSERFVTDEISNLETLQSHLRGVDGCQQMCGFYGNMQVLLNYLLRSTGKGSRENPRERHGDDRHQDTPRGRHKEDTHWDTQGGREQTVQEKLQQLTDDIVWLIDDWSDRDGCSQTLRVRLDEVFERLGDVTADVQQLQQRLTQSVRQRSTGKGHHVNPQERRGEDRQRDTQEGREQTVQEKLQQLADDIVWLIDDCSDRDEHSQVLERLGDVTADVQQLQQRLRQNMRQRRRFERETLSLVHSVQELQRVQREVSEKQRHLVELSEQRQTMKRKTKHHRKQLQETEQTMTAKHAELTRLQDTLAERLRSADRSMQVLLQLLPDLQDEVSDVTLTSEATSLLGSRTVTQMSVVSNPERQEMSIMNQTSKPGLPKLETTDAELDIDHENYLKFNTLEEKHGKSQVKASKLTTTNNKKTDVTLTSSEIDRWLAEQQSKTPLQDLAKKNSLKSKQARQVISKVDPDEAKTGRKVVAKTEPCEAKSTRKTKEYAHKAESDVQVIEKPHSKEATSVGQVMAKAEPQEAKSAEHVMTKRHAEREITVNVSPTITHHDDTMTIKPQRPQPPAITPQPPVPTPHNNTHQPLSTRDLRPANYRTETVDNDGDDGGETNDRLETGTRPGRSSQSLHAVSTGLSTHKTRSLKTTSTKHSPLEDSTGDATHNKVVHRRHLSRQTLPANKIQLRMPSQ